MSHNDQSVIFDFGSNQSSPEAFSVVLESRQIGEAYHFVICGLLLRNSGFRPDASLNYDADSRMKPIVALFNWYNLTFTSLSKNEQLNETGAAEVTEVISAAFRACRAKNTEDRNDQALRFSSDELFGHIRGKLDEVALQNMQRCPSDVAKSWLNGYLDLTSAKSAEGTSTSQGTKAKKRVKGPSTSNWEKLLEKRDVERLAVIHVRRAPPSKSEVGRLMDHINLQEPETCPPFSHVLLYGDFAYGKGDELTGKAKILPAHSLAAKVRKFCNNEEGQVNVGFVSRPWQNNSPEDDTRNEPGKDSVNLAGIETELESDTEDETDTEDEDVEKLWREFHDIGPKSDLQPVHVKILGIWLSLHKLYAPSMCVIGHRSGFIEAAAFIGIPVFYLNNERAEIIKAETSTEPGNLLWRPIKDPMGDRLRTASNVMNTMIPIESFGARLLVKKVQRTRNRGSDSDPKTSEQTDNGQEANTIHSKEKAPKRMMKKMNQVASRVFHQGQRKRDDTLTLTEAQRDTKPAKEGKKKVLTLRCEKGYENELAGALFVFMCCGLNYHYKNGSGHSKYDFLPAWKQRVALMQDVDSQHGEGEAPIGQQWLKAQYDFTDGIAKEASKHENNVPERARVTYKADQSRDSRLDSMLQESGKRQRRSQG